MKLKKYRYWIGIDAGANTGFALWDSQDKCLKLVESMKIHEAMQLIANLSKDELENTFIRIEDARKREWFGNAGKEKLQGAGSVKRDCTIWEDYLTDLGADFLMVPPKNNRTKMNADAFKKLTKWDARTNEHARDAAMLVFGR